MTLVHLPNVLVPPVYNEFVRPMVSSAFSLTFSPLLSLSLSCIFFNFGFSSHFLLCRAHTISFLSAFDQVRFRLTKAAALARLHPPLFSLLSPSFTAPAHSTCPALSPSLRPASSSVPLSFALLPVPPPVSFLVSAPIGLNNVLAGAGRGLPRCASCPIAHTRPWSPRTRRPTSSVVVFAIADCGAAAPSGRPSACQPAAATGRAPCSAVPGQSRVRRTPVRRRSGAAIHPRRADGARRIGGPSSHPSSAPRHAI